MELQRVRHDLTTAYTEQQYLKRGNAFAEVLQCRNTSCHRIPGNLGFPGGLDGKESVPDAGDPGCIPGSGRSPGEGNGYPLQCSCLENSMNGGAWWAAVHGVTKTQT